MAAEVPQYKGARPELTDPVLILENYIAATQLGKEEALASIERGMAAFRQDRQPDARRIAEITAPTQQP